MVPAYVGCPGKWPLNRRHQKVLSGSEEKKQFHGGNIWILGACQMSVHCSQIHHHMKAQSDTK